MQEKGLPQDEVRSRLDAAANRDTAYPDGRILSSMCTDPLPIAREAHEKFVVSNLGDPGLFPGATDLERDVVRMLSDLLHLDEGDGYVTTGGTESNIQALRILRDISNAEDPEVIVPRSAHFSFEKAAALLGIELREADLDDSYRVDPDAVENLVTENTAGIVGIAGTTETGQVDPIPALSDVAQRHDLPLHVDAAFGGLVLPFLDDAPPFDFSLPGVTTVAIDPHKMGLSTIPAGCLLVRNPAHLDTIAVDTPYLSSDAQHSLAGTRTGAGAASAYAALTHLGRNGYRDIAHRCISDAHWLADRVEEVEGAEVTVPPVLNLVSIATPDPEDTSRRLHDRGWHTSVSTTPEALRIVLMPHLTRDTLNDFLDDLEDVAQP